jgi:hypothetical protein
MNNAVTVLAASRVASDGLAMEDLIWRAVDGVGSASDLVRDCSFLLMVSVDPLDARGISCMTVGGLLHQIPEHTRLDNGAMALLMAQAMVAAEGTIVCVLGWEKPTDTSVDSLVALAGEPHYERPLHWTAGLEDALEESRQQGTAVLLAEPSQAVCDRAVCLVLGPGSGPSLTARRVSATTGGVFGQSPVQFPTPSPVAPLWQVADGDASGRISHSYPVGAGQHIVVEVVHA